MQLDPYSNSQLSAMAEREVSTVCGSGRVLNVKSTRPLPQTVLTKPSRLSRAQLRTAIAIDEMNLALNKLKVSRCESYW